MEKNNYNKILVIQTASIGDVILATALLEQLHDEYPRASIDFLIKDGIQKVLENHPFINDVIVWNKKNKLKSWLCINKKVRHNKYDLIVDIQRFMLTGLWTVLSGAKDTRGFDKNPLSCFFKKRFVHEIKKGIHEIDRNYSLVADIVGERRMKPRLYPECVGYDYYEGGKYYTISPGSLWLTKQCPTHKWIELIATFSSDSEVFVLGGKDDKNTAEEIIRQSQNHKVTDMTGKLTLLESAAMMKNAEMNYVNDSAPMHLASSVNAPVTAVYCSTTPDFGFGPLSDKSYIIENTECNCRPCGLHGRIECPKGTFECGEGCRLM